MYCRLFETYVDEAHCDSCDKRAGYKPDTWKYTCDRVRRENHPIWDSIRFWTKPYAWKMKLCIIVKTIANGVFGRNWTVWANREGWHVGKMSGDNFMILDGEV